MKTWSSFTHPHVIPDWKSFISTMKTKGRKYSHMDHVCDTLLVLLHSILSLKVSEKKQPVHYSQNKQSYSTAWKDMRVRK